MRIGPVLLPLRGTHGAALPAYDSLPLPALENQQEVFGRGDDAVGNPQRAQIVQFELFELTLSLKLDRQLSIEQFEATVSQSAVPSPPSGMPSPSSWPGSATPSWTYATRIYTPPPINVYSVYLK